MLTTEIYKIFDAQAVDLRNLRTLEVLCVDPGHLTPHDLAEPVGVHLYIKAIIKPKIQITVTYGFKWWESNLSIDSKEGCELPLAVELSLRRSEGDIT